MVELSQSDTRPYFTADCCVSTLQLRQVNSKNAKTRAADGLYPNVVSTTKLRYLTIIVMHYNAHDVSRGYKGVALHFWSFSYYSRPPL
jgi:hypothetical protein